METVEIQVAGLLMAVTATARVVQHLNVEMETVVEAVLAQHVELKLERHVVADKQSLTSFFIL